MVQSHGRGRSRHSRGRTAPCHQHPGHAQVLFPSVTALNSLWLYRLDVTIRDAALLGIAGPGGIGFYITNTIQLFQFKIMSTYIILALVVIFTVDIISALLRRLARRS